MKHHRLYCRPIKRPQVELTGPEAHHAVGVLRHREGDRIELFDGAGTLVLAQIRAIRPGSVLLDVLECHTAAGPPARHIILAASLAQADRFDWLIEKCTELGVDRICPVRFARTVKMARGKKVTDRFVNLSIAAAKQCGRLFLPRIDSPADLKPTLDTLAADSAPGSILYGRPHPGAPSLLHLEAVWQHRIVFVGPEGGLTRQEEHLLLEHGARAFGLTATVLRIETAAVACAAILGAQRDAV